MVNAEIFDRVVVVGNTSWGTTLANQFAQIVSEVIILTRTNDDAEEINKNHCKIGEFLFNHKTSELIKEDSSLKINLTELENRFLNYMIKRHKGATKSQILSEVWKHNKQLDTHTLESLIYRLRKKIEKNPNKPCILINDTKKYFLINAK